MKNIFSSWQNKKVLIIGDVMVDRYLYGTVERISPEAPVPVLNLEEEKKALGGAANVAMNIKALGGYPIVVGVVGFDSEANWFWELLEQNGLDTSGILVENDRKTTVKTRVSSAGQQMMRIDRESRERLSTYTLVDLIYNLKEQLAKKIDVVIVQDYNKGLLYYRSIQSILKLAKEANVPVVVDPKNKNFFTFKNVSLFKPNLKEVQAQYPFEIKATDIGSLRETDAYIRSYLKHGITMITLSEHGIYLNDGKKDLIVPTQKRNIRDVCGAGDTVLSVAALALITEIDIETLGKLANLAGGQVCERMGVVAVDKEQLAKEWLNS